MSLTDIIAWITSTVFERLSKVITREELTDILPKSPEIKWNDNLYRLYPDSLVEAAIWLSSVKLHTYIKEYKDCDEFSLFLAASMKMKFPGIAFGIVHVTWIGPSGELMSHAMNIWINQKRQIKYVEPQNGDIMDKPSNYKTHFIFI